MPRALRACLLVSILLIIAVAICLAVWFVGTLVFGLPTARDSLGPPAPGDLRIVWTIEVEPGASAQDVIDQLTTIGLINKPILFRSYIRYLGLDRGIETGMYDLDGSMSIREMAAALQSARIEAFTLTIPEGWRAEEIAARVEVISP
jgi:cell division protein YceG involved in septum cleavage